MVRKHREGQPREHLLVPCGQEATHLFQTLVRLQVHPMVREQDGRFTVATTFGTRAARSTAMGSTTDKISR